MKTGKICEKHPELRGLRYNGGNCAQCACDRHRVTNAANREKKKETNRLYREKHRVRINEQTREWQLKNPERVRENNLRRLGFTCELYDSLVEEQEHSCAICGKDLTTLPKKQVHADHDHRTLKPRGVLCHHCNTGLGAFRDDAEVLKNAIKYLEKHNEEKVSGR
jgi:hypothetical protein